MTVYAVVYSNYSPPEVDSLWFSAAEASNRSTTLGGMWEVTEMEIQGENPYRRYHYTGGR